MSDIRENQEREELHNEMKNRDRFPKIREVAKKELYSFLVGDVCGLAYQEPIKTKPSLVVEYLQMFLEEGFITNEQINRELSKIDVSVKENAWLVLMYIEEQLRILQFTEYPYTIRIDIDMLKEKLMKMPYEYWDDYTVKYVLREIKEETGYEIAPPDGSK